MNIVLIGTLLFCTHLLLSFLTFFDAQSRGLRPFGYTLFVLTFGFFGFGVWVIMRERLRSSPKTYRREIKGSRPSSS